jgi:hypothetical protein
LLLADFLDERGWSNEDAAVMLAQAGVVASSGNPIGAKTVNTMRTRDVPKRWAAALGVELELERDEPGGPGEAATDSAGSRPPERSPLPPDGARFVVEPGARKRIAGIYRFAGAALATGAQSPGIAHVWGDQADPIAELWIQAAEENPWARRFVDLVSAGGVAGDLAAAHLYLAGATLYVIGAAIPGGDAIFAKYGRYRVVVAEQPAEPEPQPERQGDNGAAPAGAENPLGDVPGPVP